jgi:glycosyltransferase involved in cell wall biosynthesis
MPPGHGLRILQATPGYAPAYELGGPTQSLEGLDDHLLRLGVDVRVLTTDSAGRERLQVARGWTSWRGVPVRYVPRWLRPDVTPTYLPLAIVEARRAHVVHVTYVFSLPSMQALAAAKAVGRPVVLSARGALEPAALAYGPARKKRVWLRAFAPLIRSASLFHATSSKEADSVRRVLGPATEVRVVPNGVDLPPPRAVAGAQGIPTIGFIGRIHRIKAVENLVEAAAILRSRGLSFRLHIAGPTPDVAYREELEARIARLRLGESATILGEVRGEAKGRFYESCWVSVLPSFTENFGNVVTEALSYGVPVVASRFTPWAELEEAGCGRWTGNAPPELADAIEPYLRSADLSREHGARGRLLVERRYTWDAVARAMIDVYREALGAAAGAGAGSGC